MLMQPSRYRLASVDEARKIVLDRTPVLEAEEVPLADSLGRVLAEAVHSEERIPPFASSRVDGYAVVAADDSPARDVLTEITAGRVGEVVVRPGVAARIMTGAPLPPGADAVVMVEDTSEAGGKVTIRQRAKAGDNVHGAGLDLAVGQLVLPAGATLGPPEIGLLATLGRARLMVRRRPLVAVLATGDELVDVAEMPGPGGIRDANRPSLLAAVAEAGGIAVSLGIGRDSMDEQARLIRRGLAEADVLVTSGGVSVGSRDLIKPILERLGEIHVGRVAIKPGKPFTFATAGGKLAFGLPGFPVSTLVTFEVFVRPALRRMQGYSSVQRPRVEVIVEHAVRPSPDRTEYQRAVVRYEGGRLLARTTGEQVSSRLLSMIGANALIVVEPGEGLLPAGATVPAYLTGPLAG
jgi:molybdopterin molybdotransferase